MSESLWFYRVSFLSGQLFDVAPAWLLCQWGRQLYNVATVCRLVRISTNARARSNQGEGRILGVGTFC